MGRRYLKAGPCGEEGERPRLHSGMLRFLGELGAMPAAAKAIAQSCIWKRGQWLRAL